MEGVETARDPNPEAEPALAPGNDQSGAHGVRVQQAIEASGQSVWVWDPDADTVTVAGPFWEQAGKPDVGPTLPFDSFTVLTDDASAAAAELRQSADAPGGGAVVLRVPAPDGEVREFTVTFGAIEVADGGTVFAGLVRDSTDAIQLRRELHKARSDAQQASVAKSEFLAIVSHELRTPINASSTTRELSRLELQDRSALG